MAKDSLRLWSGLLLVLAAGTGALEAQLSTWQIGGSGLAWSDDDTLAIMIDFESAPSALQPIYLTPERSIFAHLSNWSDDRISRELGFVLGERPRAWRTWDGDVRNGYRGSYLVDGDSTTYNPSTSGYQVFEWYTIDTAVPVPAHRFGFFPPSKGYRTDGIPLSEDAVPAFEVSIAPDAIDPGLEASDNPQIGIQIADVQENFETKVHIDFPRQYVRFIRYKRNPSAEDQRTVVVEDLNAGEAVKGTIADFELFGEGVPRRALYTTRILDLGRELNVGRLHWSATPLRHADGVDRVDPTAWVEVAVEVRTGRDDDPNVYHEFTDKGLERVVSRDRYEKELKPPASGQEGKPGLRASVGYDTENWTYWSPPFTRSGQFLALKSGSRIQLKITLHSREFDAYVRLDSLWIETAPLLADRILGEVARQDEPQPARGFIQVPLGEMVDYVYDLQARFSRASEQGFDAVRIRTRQPAHFRDLEIGDPPIPVEPLAVFEEETGLVVHLPQRISASHDEPVRLVFATELFVYATTFTGEVFDTTTESLPQPVEPGDAGERITTSSLRVLGVFEKEAAPVQEVTLSTPVLTPNGDGIHDQVEIAYALFHLPEDVPVKLEIFDLVGRRVARIDLGRQTSGQQRALWDGRAEEGALLPPGLYIVDVALKSEALDAHRLVPLGIAY